MSGPKESEVGSTAGVELSNNSQGTSSLQASKSPKRSRTETRPITRGYAERLLKEYNVTLSPEWSSHYFQLTPEPSPSVGWTEGWGKEVVVHVSLPNGIVSRS